MHLPRRQVRALHVRRVPAHQLEHLVWITIDDRAMHRRPPTARALVDHLHVLPVWLRLLLGRRTPPPLIGRHLAPGLHQGSAIIAFAIGCHRRTLLAFGIPPFSPLLPTYAHIASS